jgi:type II secretory ATPase GspE/PulE/Tfp pilus assembly ATPase PilB-like protein
MFLGRLLGLRAAPKPRKPIRLRITGTSEDGSEDDPRIAGIVASRGFKSALSLLSDAIRMRADHVYLEPAQEDLAVAFRIDGMKEASAGFSRGLGEAVVGILKELAELNPEEKRKPQEGRFFARVSEQRTIEFCVTCSGTMAGEKLTVRIFDHESSLLMLSELGMPRNVRELIHDMVTRPHGLLVVCGPADSGKTTTINACLAEMDRYRMNVVALETALGIRVPNVKHIQINPKSGQSVATELPALHRQGLDALSIGEIGDSETAILASRTAKDGIMVLGTFEAQDSVMALGTLLELGVKPSLLRSSLMAVLAQRLIRVLCRRCRVRYKPDPDMLYKANLPGDEIKFFYRPPEPLSGESTEETPICEHCRGSGYIGRTGVFELLIVTDRMRELIRDETDLYSIRQEAVKQGMKRLQEEGMRLVIEGKTSIQEVIRMCS